jgi:predicted transcriptional regulator
MTRSHRNSWKIILDILRSGLGEGAKKTHIMYRANLNCVSFKKVFPVLVDEGYMVEVDDPDGGVLYRISEKGRILLKLLNSVEESLPRKKRVT